VVSSKVEGGDKIPNRWYAEAPGQWKKKRAPHAKNASKIAK
jgi:hypothetical protein